MSSGHRAAGAMPPQPQQEPAQPPYPALAGTPLYKLPGWLQRSLVLGPVAVGRAALGDYGHVHATLVAFFKRMAEAKRADG